MDSVHQGDQDGVKGVYHINAVDCVTQYERVATCENISEAYLLPLLASTTRRLSRSDPRFHTDNGSEYINHKVAKMLDKLRVEFTKSRRALQRQWLGRNKKRISKARAIHFPVSASGA